MFAPMVEDETKNQTVRARRKDGKIPQPGQMLYLFTGLRTRNTRRLRETPCKAVKGIYIDAKRIILYDRPLDDQEMFLALKKPLSKFLPNPEQLTVMINQFAWLDGFRPHNGSVQSTFEAPGPAFAMMINFWKKTHDLPFVGDLIEWEGKNENSSTTT